MISVTVTVMLPALLLPRPLYLMALRGFLRSISLLEILVLGLRYEVTGLENLPKDGNYIAGMKHHSAYETLKLPIIFNDPAIVLKKELSQIPIWGWHVIKLGMIPVDRKAKGKAMAAMLDSAKDLLKHAPHRPIVIFPQGTRVHTYETPDDRPYKMGIIRMYEALNLPIIPIAINSGVFWGRKTFLKRPGVVTFKFLPAIEAGLAPEEALKRLTDAVESESNALVEQAQQQLQRRNPAKTCLKALLGLAVIACIAWTASWQQMEGLVRSELAQWKTQMQDNNMDVSHDDPVITGFPGAVKLRVDNLTLTSANGIAKIPTMMAQAWPVPGAELSIILPDGVAPAPFDLVVTHADMRIDGLFPILPWRAIGDITLPALTINAAPFTLSSSGAITLDDDGAYNGQFTHKIRGADAFTAQLIEQKTINKTIGLLVQSWLRNQAKQSDDGSLTLQTPVKNNAVYLGPFRIFEIQ